MSANDHFSGFARTYAAYLPTYPDELFVDFARIGTGQKSRMGLCNRHRTGGRITGSTLLACNRHGCRRGDD